MLAPPLQTIRPWHLPAEPPAAVSPPATTSDPNVELLRSMFPEVEADTLTALLIHHDADVQRVIDALLDMSAATDAGAIDASSRDAEMAARLQEEQDAEMAKAMQASLEQELRQEDKAEAERRKQNAPHVQAAKAINTAADKTKALLSKIGMGRSSKPSETHGTRLIDAPLEVNTDDFRPIADYAPPNLAATMAAPAQPTWTTDTTVDVSDGTASATPSLPGGWGAPQAPPAPMTDVAGRYNSRLDRARNANRARVSSASPPVAATATLAPLTAADMMAAPVPSSVPSAPSVPEGQLI